MPGDGADYASANCPSHPLGDMNGDGTIDLLDSQLSVTALLGYAICPRRTRRVDRAFRELRLRGDLPVGGAEGSMIT